MVIMSYFPLEFIVGTETSKSMCWPTFLYKNWLLPCGLVVASRTCLQCCLLAAGLGADRPGVLQVLCAVSPPTLGDVSARVSPGGPRTWSPVRHLEIKQNEEQSQGPGIQEHETTCLLDFHAFFCFYFVLFCFWFLRYQQ